MLEIFEYKEIEVDNSIPYIDQLNTEGKKGWEFVLQGQKVENTIDFKTGQNKITIITIYKKKTIKTNGTA